MARILALFLLCGCQPVAGADQGTPTAIVRTDAALLGQRIHLPDGIQSARWSVVPLGNVGAAAPGPTDTRLYAFLQPDIAAAANLRHLPSEQQPTSATIPPGIARSLLPPETLATLSPDAAGDLLLAGERYDPSPFDQGAYRGVFAVRAGDGLLLCLQTS